MDIFNELNHTFISQLLFVYEVSSIVLATVCVIDLKFYSIFLRHLVALV